MKKNYTEIAFLLGSNIESAIQELQRYKKEGKLVYGSFNGHLLYSDIDDIDSAYKKILGKSKAEWDAEDLKRNQEYKEQQEKHKQSIPELTKEWIKKGNEILDKKYHKLWAKCVPIRLNDLYEGMELPMCLEIVNALNNNESFDKVKVIIEGQGHSGMSYGLICSMIKSFSDKGEEFVTFLKKK